ncbi:hypothetical protein C8R45DRAFT_822477 [Mycena sanguinolenta]|nr:hypothetical protein C8R45DRAFT_822477 [Mycena sanguinolenta]
MLKGIFDLDTSLVVFKGHSESQIRIVYSIRAPGRIRNLFLYIGGLIVVLGIRRGDFRDYNTMEELLAGDDDKLHWKDPDLPFFRAAGPRGLKMTANPMTSEGARAFLHKTAAAVGINEGQARASPYSFRANFATVVKKAAGNDTAAKSMGHRAGSHTVAEIYDVGLSRYDFFGLGSGEEMRDNVQQGRSVAVYAAPVKVKPLEVAELVEQDPSIALLIKEAQNLKECIRTGGEGWKELLVSPHTVPYVF